jgi:integrase
MAGLAPLAYEADCVFGIEAGPNCGKSEPEAATGSAGASPSNPCPQCGSKKIWHDGLRYSDFGSKIQRWLCRECGLRFSDQTDVKAAWKMLEQVETVHTKAVKRGNNKEVTRQICVAETKNLETEQEKIQVPCGKEGELKGAIVDFLWQLKKQNYAEDSITSYGYSLLALVHLGIDLFNPETFLTKMALQNQLTSTRKYNLTKAYRSFLNMHQIKAKLPKYKLTRPLPYIPPEEFLDQLIACSSQMLAAFLQTLKETAARPGEAWKIEWDDLDVDGKKLHISHPEKGCNPRIRPISPKLIRMILALPRTQKRIFTYKSKNFAGKTFRQMRKRAITKLGNPELRKIDFYTCRYWRATMEYRRLHDFGSVMVLLGHKSLRYVLLYAQLSESYDTDKGYVCKEAHNVRESKELLEAGFDYIMDKEGVSLFRKLK